MSGLLNKHESMLKNYRLEGEESDEDEHVNRSNKKASRTQAASSTSKPTQAMDRNDDYQDDDDSDDDEKDISPNAGTGSKNTDAASTRKVNDCKIFVGNLPFTALKQDLEILFSQVSTLYSM